MIHLALRARSLYTGLPYTATGLGDRIHSATLAWAYGQAHDEPVTIHLTADKWTGGQFSNKPESWAEIVSLFPNGSLAVQPHPVIPKTEAEWLSYLRKYDPVTYFYGDYPGKTPEKGAIDISPYLSDLPLLSFVSRLAFPDKFITAQWDANGKSRTLSQKQREAASDHHRELGYSIILVGGEGEGFFKHSLNVIACAMSRAELHVGVDSAFFHMAQLYMPKNRIRIYSNLLRPGHHVIRAVKNGAKLIR
jgi:hypothetical protein